MIDKFTAVVNLVGGHLGQGAGGEITYYDGQTPPSESDVDAKYNEVLAEWDAQEYARNRQAEYPSIAELTVALYDTDDKAAIETKRAAVKTKYPKPSQYKYLKIKRRNNKWQT